MSAVQTPASATHTSGTTGTTTTPLVTVVGYDGTASSRQALIAASSLIDGRDGRLEIVYVAHTPGAAAMSAESEAAVLETFDEIEVDLSHQVRDALSGEEQRWSFSRRDGNVAHELVEVAKGLRKDLGDDATIVIVVGASMHALHQVIGSVPVSLARQATFPLLVVPVLHTGD
jgi:nucleotide-binding universal stress UspA family protein